jgi:hypothetical protein
MRASPGHSPAWRDKDFLNPEEALLESIVSQVVQAEQKEPLCPKFTHDGKDLNEQFRR